MANEKRLIYREDLLAEYDRVHIGEPGKARKLIGDAPTVDAVEVVRCKDCKYWDQRVMISPIQGMCKKFTNAPYLYSYRARNDFCSYGERKDNEVEKV